MGHSDISTLSEVKDLITSSTTDDRLLTEPILALRFR